MALEGLLDGGLRFRPMTLPDRYIEHGTQVMRVAVWGFATRLHSRALCPPPMTAQQEQLAEAGLTASHIAATVLSVLGRKRDAVLAS